MLLQCACGTRPNHEATEKEVFDLVKTLERANNSLDQETILSLIDDSFTMLQDGKRLAPGETLKQIAMSMPEIKRLQSRFIDIKIKALAHDLALASFIFHDDIMMKDGTHMQKWGPTTLLFERTVSGWKMIYGDSDHYDESPMD